MVVFARIRCSLQVSGIALMGKDLLESGLLMEEGTVATDERATACTHIVEIKVLPPHADDRLSYPFPPLGSVRLARNVLICFLRLSISVRGYRRPPACQPGCLATSEPWDLSRGEKALRIKHRVCCPQMDLEPIFVARTLRPQRIQLLSIAATSLCTPPLLRQGGFVDKVRPPRKVSYIGSLQLEQQ
jgi:hypothetical protein